MKWPIHIEEIVELVDSEKIRQQKNISIFSKEYEDVVVAYMNYLHIRKNSNRNATDLFDGWV